MLNEQYRRRRQMHRAESDDKRESAWCSQTGHPKADGTTIASHQYEDHMSYGPVHRSLCEPWDFCERGYFQYDGSTYCLIFEPGVINSFVPKLPFHDDAPPRLRPVSFSASGIGTKGSIKYILQKRGCEPRAPFYCLRSYHFEFKTR
jgi:hypothetical protein